ncbi:MAG: hypothetical protein JSS34_02550 [Proteobacteria bacterium]|nr:hypothetical protein [Pseudomonadota bacterium]
MKLRVFFLYFALFFLSLVSYSHGIVQMGLDDYINAKCQQHGRAFNPDLLPSREASNFNILQTFRFFGNLGGIDPQKNMHIHPQCIFFEDSEFFLGFPQDAITSFIQHLFPSPDRVILVANQSGDVLGKLDPLRVGKILRLFEDQFLNPQDENVFKSMLYRLLLKKEKLLTEEKYYNLMKEYPEFLERDFKKNLSSALASYCTNLREDLEKDLKVSPIDPLFLTHVLQAMLNKNSQYVNIFHSGFLAEGEIESYQTALMPQREESEIHTRLRYFKNKENEFEALRFIEIFVNAIEEQRRNTNLPRSLMQRAIFYFFWQKATETTDVQMFLRGYLDVEDIDSGISYPTQQFKETTYWEIRNNPKRLEEALRIPENAAFLVRGYDLFENSYPPKIQYRTAFYKGKSAPDCMETLARRFLYYLVWTKMGAGYGFSKHGLALSENSLLEKCWEDIFTIEEAFLQKTRNIWMENVSNLPHVRYLKSTEGKAGTPDYEIAPGIINMLNVIRTFVPDPTNPNSIAYEPALEAIHAEFKRLCSFFQREGFMVSYEERDVNHLTFHTAKQDYFGDITFNINGEKAFDIVVESLGHGTLKMHKKKGDWKSTVKLGSLHGLPPELQAFFWNPDNLDFFKEQSPQSQKVLLSSLDIDALETKLSVIHLVYRSYPEGHAFVINLLKSPHFFWDTFALEKLTESLMSLYQKEGTFLDDEKMEQIFSVSQELMGVQLKEPFLDSGEQTLCLWALQHSKDGWLKAGLPSITHLCLIDIEPPQNKETPKVSLTTQFCREWLVQCTKLKSLSFNDSMNEAFKDALSVSLKKLNHLSSLSLSTEVSFLPSLLECLPPALEKCYIPLVGKTPRYLNDTLPFPMNEEWKTCLLCFETFFKTGQNVKFRISSRTWHSNKEKNDKFRAFLVNLRKELLSPEFHERIKFQFSHEDFYEEMS